MAILVSEKKWAFKQNQTKVSLEIETFYNKRFCASGRYM